YNGENGGGYDPNNPISFVPPSLLNPNNPNLPQSPIVNLTEFNPPYIWEYQGDDGTVFVDIDPTIEPYLEFNPSDNYEIRFPRFTELVKNLKSFVKNNPKLFNALQKWSGFSKQEILEKLIFRQGNGPKIKVNQLAGAYGHYNHKNAPGILEIDEAVVAGLEISQLQSTKQGTAFLLAVTILHEFVHFGENSNGIKNTGKFEFGDQFEIMTFGVTITTVNAIRVSILFNK
ncbi:MAG: hypothetical protein EAZ13_09880, partial [Sphingobacteriia bacterium]